MAPLILGVLSMVVIFYVMKWLCAPRYPGPSLLQIIRQLNPKKLHLVLTTFADKYGPVYQFSLPANKMLVVSGYAEIHEVLVSRGKDFMGRPLRFVNLYLTDCGRSIVLNARQKPWRTLRKLVSSHMKQHGAGMDRLEMLFQGVGDDMIKSMLATNGEAFDPLDMVYQAAYNSIQVLLGQQPDDKRFQLIRSYEDNVVRTILSPAGMLLDAFPWIRHFGYKAYQDIKELVSTKNNIWEKLKQEIPFMDEEKMTRVLVNAITDTHSDSDELIEDDIKNTIITLYTAGMSTTARSFYALISLCLNHETVMKKLREEVDTVVGCSRLPTLTDRPDMPYTRAVIYEVLRYTSVAPLSLPHKSIIDSSIGEIPVPAGTVVCINLWALHHDETFWGDPWAFRPERFLTEDLDDVVPADHPNRKHLLSFGAGPRVCLGEDMAMARLFLWTAALMQRVELEPEVKHNPVSCDCRDFMYSAILLPTRYQIRTIVRASD